MESIEARALKSSFLSQLTMKTNPQIFHNDDVWCLTKINSVAGAADDFPVEDLLNLDLPEKEFQDFSEEDHRFPQNALSDHSSSAFTGADEVDNISSSAFNGSDEIDSLSELAVPVDDLENLEWLSQFVDDSTSGLSLLCPAGSFKPGGNSGKRAEQVNRPAQNIRAPRFPFPVQGKPRSKRSRKPSDRPWKLASPTLTPVDPSPTPSSSHGSSTLSAFVLENPVQDAYWFFSSEKPPAKRHRRKAEAEGVLGRRCTHCQVQKTPQWRTGPLGPKTLCNACGVRYKSGRLFPEYRPAFSPTFSHELHSNSHRKVLEMRRRKEMGGMVVGTGFPQVMRSL